MTRKVGWSSIKISHFSMRVDSVFYMALKVKVMVDIDTRTERKKAAEMKKTYVKPIMEMEGFVPNEYVAACWNVKCSWADCGYTGITIGGDKYSSDDLGKCVADMGNEEQIHAGKHSFLFFSEDSEGFYHGQGFGWHHKLIITPVSEDDPHPNASN